MKLTLFPMPTGFQIEPTDACNLQCRHCNRDEYIKIPRTIKFDDFKKVVDQIELIRYVNIQGYGEPLLNPQLPEMIRYIKSKHPHCYAFFYTNGVLFNEEKMKQYIGVLDEMRISIDGATKETFELIRRGAKFDVFLKCVKMVTTLKKKMGAKKPKIVFRATAMKANFLEMPRLIELAKELGVEEVAITNLGLQEGTTMATEDQLVRNLDKKEVRRVLAILEHERDIKINIDPEIYHELHHDKRKPFEQKTNVLAALDGGSVSERKDPWYKKLFKKKGFYCWWPWNSVYLSTDGSVQPCCYYWYTKETTPFSIGENINKKTLSQIWHSEGYEKLREGLLSGKPLSVCAMCPQKKDLYFGFSLVYYLSYCKKAMLRWFRRVPVEEPKIVVRESTGLFRPDELITIKE